MAGTLKNLDCHPIKIGGIEDHVHVFSSLLKNIAFSDLIGRLKGASSKRLKEKGLPGFGWQNGYGAFSVSESNVAILLDRSAVIGKCPNSRPALQLKRRSI